MTEEELCVLASTLARLTRVGDCITLEGELGSGKTTFARAFIRALLGPVEVPSPTFTLLQTYDIPAANGVPTPLWHMDLYRLKHADELYELGLEEGLQSAIVLIEWPRIAQTLLPGERLALTLESVAYAPRERLVVCNPTPSWYIRLQNAGITL